MSKNAKIRLAKYGITGLCCLAVSLYLIFQNELSELTTLDLYRVISDAFVLPGVLLALFGLLIYASNEGALDAVGFVLRSALNALIPGRPGERIKYADYVEERRGKRKNGYGFLFIVGAVWIVISLVFLALFHSEYQV